jgi:uncharacterized membrane protein (UPF0182 family)
MPGFVVDIERRRERGRLGCGGLLAALVVLLLFARTIAVWVLDLQWWGQLGQLAAFWQHIYVHTAPLFYATAFGFAVLWIVHARALKSAGTGLSRHPWYGRIATLAMLPIAWILAAAQFSSWNVALWVGSRGIAGSGWRDPIFNNPLEFYFFDLPMYQSLAGYLFVLLVVCAIGYWVVNRFWTIGHMFRGPQIEIEWRDLTGGNLAGVRILAGLALLALAAGEWLGRYQMLYVDHVFLTGADYVAAHLSVPLQAAWSMALAAAAVLVMVGRHRVAAFALILLPIRAVVPQIVNSAYVRPNEITLQKPYIEHHLQATRRAFGIADRMKEVNYNASAQARIDVAKNRATLENVRLWDWQAFHDTVSQIQPLRPYVFVDTDVDRYRINGTVQQVLLSPRELDIQQLGEARNRWPNRHVIYTHGYGIVMADANRITSDGLPRLFIQDAPPKVQAAGLKLTRPEIYFGEVEHEPVFVRTTQPEFNYPSGADNVHNRYDGDGGIPIGSFGMRLAAAVAYADWNILLTSYLQDDSRMLIRRRVQERLETLAPFLQWDPDPYLVLTPDGRLVWMADGFTFTNRYPYSERVRVENWGVVNYVRNSVKATVDAYTGETALYVIEPGDPLIQAYQKLFPRLLLDGANLPSQFREHIRYPEKLFQMQAEVLLTYHMTSSEAFYNKVDVWDIARRPAPGERNAKIPIDANFMVAVLPPEAGGKGEPEFVLMLPFTPRGKDNLLGMLIARCDGASYGQMILMMLPKEQLFFGPMQIDSRINQDQNISKDLTLWNQQGSQVLRGQMVVLPVDNTFLYVQPLYLQASQARMPEIKRVVLAHGNELIYADSYQQALQQLAGMSPAPAEPPAPRDRTQPAETGTPAAPAPAPRIETLRQLMDRYRRAASQGQWSEAGRALEALEAELKKQP